MPSVSFHTDNVGPAEFVPLSRSAAATFWCDEAVANGGSERDRRVCRSQLSNPDGHEGRGGTRAQQKAPHPCGYGAEASVQTTSAESELSVPKV